jgi:hypothetical protein
MVEAYVLATELTRSGGDHVEAFARYGARLAPSLRSKQDAAEGFGAGIRAAEQAAPAGPEYGGEVDGHAVCRESGHGQEPARRH